MKQQSLGLRLLFACALLLGLSACGGGGGGGDSGTATSSASGSSGVPSEVTAPRTARLTWNAPLSRVDGSSLYLSEISGYRVYYTKEGSDALGTIDVTDPTATAIPLSLFGEGTFEIAVTTLDSDGLESTLSIPVRVRLI